ncbi:MAG: molybdate ABC transporter substrate-binding protein [Caldilineaceae bacterium]|nr:molybdate ABC transporter substrate-binding protein [Caldilineaceae bacterium]MCY4117449.1 molybdate ABC transporter substrate-binding protein [Caldilineaceae bacterium]
MQGDSRRRRWASRCACILGAAALLAGVWLPGGCRGPSLDTGASSRTDEVTVFAAASLTNVFQQAARSYGEGGHRGNVVFNFAGSQQLAGQLREGARADIFASADEAQMQAAIAAGRVEPGDVKTLACNRLEIGYGHSAPFSDDVDGPSALELLQKLAQPGLKIVVGAEAVPVGRYTRQFLANAAEDERLGVGFRDGFEANIVSEEQNVRGVLSKLQLGEADAGVVYASDLIGITDLQRIEIPARLNITATYPIALVQGVKQPEQAAAFIAWLFSEEGAAVLERHGFATQCRADGATPAPARASDHANE